MKVKIFALLLLINLSIVDCGFGNWLTDNPVMPGVQIQRANRGNKLNFVFILIDDMGWRDLGCYGSTYYQTPQIDRLAEQGMLFTDGYAACPLCAPSRASLMSGKYPARLHLTRVGKAKDGGNTKLLEPPQRFWKEYLDSEEVTIAEELKQAGYICGSIGKWHMGIGPCSPLQQGFCLHFGALCGKPKTYFYPYEKGMGTYTRGTYQDITDGKVGEYLTDRLTIEVEKFLEANREKPFFLYLSHFAVHTPLMSKPGLEEKYKQLLQPENPQKNQVFAGMVESVDESVGRVIKKLDELKLADNTVVIFTSDNGALLSSSSNLPLREGKATIFEGGIRVPFLVRWPEVVRAGSRCGVPVHTVDFFPTIMEIAGIKEPGSPTKDGESIVKLLKQKGNLNRDALYWHWPHYINGFTPCSVIREGDFKLVMYYEDDSIALYNLREDIGETRNLETELPRRADRMQKKLKQWLKQVGGRKPTVNPDYFQVKD